MRLDVAPRSRRRQDRETVKLRPLRNAAPPFGIRGFNRLHGYPLIGQGRQTHRRVDHHELHVADGERGVLFPRDELPRDSLRSDRRKRQTIGAFIGLRRQFQRQFRVVFDDWRRGFPKDFGFVTATQACFERKRPGGKFGGHVGLHDELNRVAGPEDQMLAIDSHTQFVARRPLDEQIPAEGIERRAKLLYGKLLQGRLHVFRFRRRRAAQSDRH